MPPTTQGSFYNLDYDGPGTRLPGNRANTERGRAGCSHRWLVSRPYCGGASLPPESSARLVPFQDPDADVPISMYRAAVLARARASRVGLTEMDELRDTNL